MSADPLAPIVRRLFGNLRHAGRTTDSSAAGREIGLTTVHGAAGRAQRGTQVRFALQCSAGRIIAVRYQAYGCPHTLAVCEWLAEELEAGRLRSIGAPADWCRTLDIPIVKLGRLLVVEDALRAALQQIGEFGADWPENVVK